MPAAILQLADAIVADLNAATFSQSFITERSYLPRWKLETCEACDGCRCESREARSDRRPVTRWVSSKQPVRRVTRIAGRVAVGVLPGR